MNLVNRAFQGIISAGQDFLRQEPRVKFAKITGAAGTALALYAGCRATYNLASTEWNQIDHNEACLLMGKELLGASMVVMEFVMANGYDALKNTLKTSPLTIS